MRYLSLILLLLPGFLFSQDSLRTDSIRQLKTVTVTAKKPLIEHQIDRSIINVAGMTGGTGGSSFELLEKLPGVQIGINNDISLHGRGGVIIMIDGRTNYLAGTDIAAYLKSLPASLVDKIELIDNPPARYDANGNAMINIRLKRNRLAGFTGSATVAGSQGVYARLNESLQLNYRSGKINLFSNLSHSFENDYNRNNYERLYLDAQQQPTSQMVISSRNRSRVPSSVNGMMGLDWQLTRKWLSGFQVNAGNYRQRSETGNEGRLLDMNGLTDSINNTRTTGRDTRKSAGLSAFSQYQFNDAGHELLTDISFQRYDNEGRQSIVNENFNATGHLQQTNGYYYLTPGRLDMLTLRAEYSRPLRNKGKLEAGLKSGWVQNDQQTTTDFHQNSNHFIYRETVNALYGSWQKGWKHWGIQLGMRMEQTRTRGTQLGNQWIAGSEHKRNYVQLFPTLYLQYKPDSSGKNTLTVILNRRIQRPNYQLLNPFLFYRDEYSYSLGNPLLLPQFQNRIELKYQRSNWLNLALSYNAFSDVIFQITSLQDKIYLSRPQNIARGFMVLLNTDISWHPTRWWQMNHYIQTSRMGLRSDDSTRFEASTWVMRYTLNNQFQIGKTWSAEAGAYYASRDLNGQAFTRSRLRIQAAMQKKWKDGKLSLRFFANDIFHTWVNRNYSVGVPQSSYTQRFETDTQRLGLSLGYRFGKESTTRRNRHGNNNDEEKNRVGY
ncbi:MAG: outer membrane beta-barrel protein [Flavihumibacter sp.]